MPKVQLYIYEVTKGLAAQMSTMLLGRYIPGIWHTGVVCFGMEYFFGSGGIQNIRPGTTIVGAPDEIIDLGETHITDELFHEYLFSIGEDRFRPEQYHLFDHNCNTFSNEVAQFLTGQSIPAYILNLPQDVANTPMGAMLKTFMDGFGSPVGGPADHSSEYFSRPQQGSRPAVSQSSQQQKPSAKRQSPAAPSPIVFTSEASDCCIKLHELFAVEKEKLNLLETVIKGGQGNGSKTVEIIEALNALFNSLECNNDTERCSLFIEALSIIALQEQCDIFKVLQGAELLDRLTKSLESYTHNAHVMQSFLKLATNLYSRRELREMFILGSNLVCSKVHKTFITHCIGILTGESRNNDTDDFTISLAFNISLSKVSEETALELASASLHWISSADRNSPTGRCCVAALRQLVKSNHQIKELAAMTMDADLLA